MRRLLTSLVFVASLAGTAYAADVDVAPAYGHPWHHRALPECDSPGVIARVAEKFSYYDSHVIGSGVAIDRIDNVREDAVAAGGPGLIDRRYCGATAWLTNGRHSSVAYLIEGPKLGTFSKGWHVESCVVGFDPWRVYDAVCRSIRP